MTFRGLIRKLFRPFAKLFPASPKKDEKTKQNGVTTQPVTAGRTSKEPAPEPSPVSANDDIISSLRHGLPIIAPIRQPTLDASSTLPVEAPPPSRPGSLDPRTSRRNSESSISQRSRSNSSSSRHRLKEQLHDARHECPRTPHSYFVPKCHQDELITVSAITRDLQVTDSEITTEEAEKHARNVYDSAKTLYAILAYMKKGDEICSLWKEGVRDDDLPLERKPNLKSRYALEKRNGRPIKTLEQWSDKSLEKFDRVQWWMEAPVFKDTEHYDLHDKTILPFVAFKPDEVVPETKQGGYSEVYPVRIHPAHHDFWEHRGAEDNQPLVAIKQLFSPDETEFLKERTILKSLGHKKHPHLIKLLATYKQGNKYHLMFPYANANLRTYWDKRPTPEFNKDTVLWSLKQMKGIANGLFLIHNFTVTYPLAVEGGIRVQGDGQLSVKKDEELFGRHGDMKPENILWFDHTTGTQDPMGVLQIADFGLGRFHGRESRSRVNPDTIVSSPTYEPPECKLRRPVSRAYDIWSLGCIFLEFVTWLLKGSAEIDGFADFRGRDATDTGINEDNFFTIISKIEGTEAVIREEVQQWVDQLHEHERCSAVIHELLNLVMDGLLKINSTDRFEASHIYQQLLVYLKKAEFDEEYLLKPVPRQEKPVSERANSTPEVRRDPQVDPTTPNGRNSDSENAQPIPRVHAVTQSHATLPRDLVLRNAGTPGTPSFRRNDNTWPMTRPLQMND